MHRFLAFAALLGASPLAGVAAPIPQVQDEAISALLRALQLPALVTEAREVGVGEALVLGVLDGLRRRGVPADDAVLVIREEIDAVRAGAPKDNFGAFVQRQLDAGLRGRALSEAIRAEHRARGIGPPEGRQPQGQGRAGGRSRGRGGRP